MKMNGDGSNGGKWARGVAELRQRHGNYADLGRKFKPSPAAFWKVENADSESPAVINVLIQEGIVETAKRCKANGWVRRAAWIHESDLDKFNEWLTREGCENLQELVDKCVQI